MFLFQIFLFRVLYVVLMLVCKYNHFLFEKQLEIKKQNYLDRFITAIK